MSQNEVLVDNKGFVPKSRGKFGNFVFNITHGQYFYLVACFFLPALIILGVYACIKVHPFGNETVLTLDLQAQYIYYYEKIRSLLVDGGSWLYSWERTLGGEFLGIVAYYGASPFNLIFAIFPKDYIADAMLAIQVCKVGAMGVTFGYYLHKTRFVSQMHTIAFAVMYSLCSYSVVELCNPMWLDAMVILPLLILGVESLIRDKKFILYTFSLTYLFITNYYIGYMVGIFTFFYFLYFYFVHRPEFQIVESKNIFKTYGFWAFFRFAFFTAVALLISAFMLIAAIYSLSFGKNSFSQANFSFSLRFDFLDLLVKMLPGSYDSVRITGLPMVYSGIISLVSIPLYFMSKKISSRSKVGAALLLSLLVLSFSINTIDLVWHGFNNPNWLNYRYSFLFSFVVIVMAYDVIANASEIKLGTLGGVVGILALAVMIIQKFNYVFEQGEKSHALDDSKCIFLSLALLVAYVVVIMLLKDKSKQGPAAFALAAIVCVEMFANGLITIDDVRGDVGSVKYDNYTNDAGTQEMYNSFNGSIKRIESVVNKVLENDTGFYRMESKLVRSGVNEGMAYGYKGIAHSTSTLNKETIKLLSSLGYSSQSHWTKYAGGTPLSDALIGIKYVITENDKLDPEIYTVYAQDTKYYKYIVSTDTIYAMQNTKALPLAYGVSPALLEYMGGQVDGTITGLEYQNDLIREMLFGTGYSKNIFVGISSTIDYEKCTFGTGYTHPTKYIDQNGVEQTVRTPYYTFDKAETGAKVKFTLTAARDGKIYFHFPADNFQKTVDIYVNGSYLCEYFDTDSTGIKELGTFKEGQKIIVELRLKKDATYISRESKYYFYYLDNDAFTEAMYMLDDCGMYIDEYGNDFVKGGITLSDEQNLVFTTIPYDEGWNIYVDGQKVEYSKVLGALIAFEAEPGTHEIEMRYMPKIYVVSYIATIIGILLFILFIVVVKVKKLNKLVFGKFKSFNVFISDYSKNESIECDETIENVQCECESNKAAEQESENDDVPVSSEVVEEKDVSSEKKEEIKNEN